MSEINQEKKGEEGCSDKVGICLTAEVIVIEDDGYPD